MKRYFKSEYYYIKSNWMNIGLFVLYFIILAIIRMKLQEEYFLVVYQMSVLIFFMTCMLKMMIYFSNMIEKQTIRYYFEYLPRRTTVLFSVYIKYLLIYILVHFLFYLMYLPFFNDEYVLSLYIHFLIYAFHSIIGMFIIVLCKSTGKSIGIYFLVAVIGSDLLNMALYQNPILPYQPFYYLSPNIFIRVDRLYLKILPFVYIVLVASLTTYMFKKKEY